MTTDKQRRRYVLVIPVPREVEIRIEDRFLGLSGVTKPLMGYHITLLGSFFLRNNSELESLDQIQQICTLIEPFDVSIGGTGAFEQPDNHAVYIAVNESASTKSLQHALWQALKQSISFANNDTRTWNLPEHFQPHVTLGLGLSDTDYQAFLNSSVDKGCEASFTVTRINLVTQDADGPWQVVRHYALGHHPAPNSSRENY